MEKHGKSITLIDGNSLMFRSYYATSYTGNLMKNKDGLYTNALFGFCSMVNKLLTEEVEYAFVAFDAGKQTFRHQDYTEYKATRKALPDELRVQIPYIKKYLDILNVKRDENLNFEADDLIASVANLVYEKFDEIRIITGDKDLLQLVNDKITVYLTKRGIGDLEEYNHENFYEKMNINPLQVTDFKGIVGDSSDNLPGIRGIGEKTAIKLLNEYQTIENIYENIEKLTGKTKDLFIQGKDIAFRCKFLATLKQDIELGFSIDDLIVDNFNVDELIAFFQEVEFNSFLKKLNRHKIDTVNTELYIVEKSNENLSNILNTDAYINIEVFKNNYYNGDFLGLSFVSEKNQIFFTKSVVLNNPDLRHYLENKQYAKKTFDYKMLYLVLKKHGIVIENVIDDFMLGAYLVNPSYASDDFKNTVDNFCSNNIAYYDNIYGANTKMKIPDLNVYAKYSVDKGLILKTIDQDIKNKLKEYNVENLYQIEISLSKVLADMELNGLLIDIERLEEIGIELTKKAEDIAQDIYFIAGEEFNINSPKQLGEILFGKLHLPHGKKNKTGYSTNVDVLEKLSKDYVIAKEVLEYRAFNKLVTTYINGLKEVVDKNNFIHPLYKQVQTLTGRLSSVEPNIQNMPIRSEEGQVIREFFVSRFNDGYIMSADYSQIELRILADMSNDEKMLEAFSNEIDFHTQTASRIYEVDLKDVTKDMRRTAKAINFGIIYGMSAWGLSEAINISQHDANVYINKYFTTYSKVKTFLDDIVFAVKNDGYTKTLFNRRRYIPEAVSENANLRSFGERTAMNAPIQGTAADIIKIAMIKIDEKIRSNHLKSLMIAQVHDELVFDVINDELEIMKKLVKDEMENAVSLKVKINADVNYGRNWSEAK